MAASIRIDPKDEQYLKQMLVRAEKKTTKTANRVIKGVALRFFISARKRTGPDKASKISKMRKKHRIRRVVSLTLSKQKEMGQFWYKDKVNNKIFARRSQISKRSRFRQTDDTYGMLGDEAGARVVPLTRAIQKYSKKKKKFVYIGTTLKRGLHDNRRDTKIPAAGAAKAGWIQGMKNLGSRKGTNIGRITPKVGRTRWIKGRNPIIKHVNEVDYVSNISPGVVASSMSAAVGWFRAKEDKKWDKTVGSEFKI